MKLEGRVRIPLITLATKVFQSVSDDSGALVKFQYSQGSEDNLGALNLGSVVSMANTGDSKSLARGSNPRRSV